MGKHVVYIRARDEKELEAAGHDPGEWVREIVKHSLEQRAGNHSDVPKPAPARVGTPDRIAPEREVTPDFRSKDMK